MNKLKTITLGLMRLGNKLDSRLIAFISLTFIVLLLAYLISNTIPRGWIHWHFYILSFLLILCGSHSVLILFRGLDTRIDNARTMFSTIVQSEAAILAIVVSLSFVVVQIAASSYSPHISELFITNLSFWILVASYLTSIVLNLGILKGLKSIRARSPQVRNVKIVNFAFSLSIFCYLVLIPYVVDIAGLLNPRTTVVKIIDEVSEDDFTAAGLLKALQPAVDIILSALANRDSYTAAYGVATINHKLRGYFGDVEIDKDKKSTGLTTLCGIYRGICRVAAHEGVELPISFAVDGIWDFCSMPDADDASLLSGLEFFEDITRTAIENDLEMIKHDATKRAVDFWQMVIPRDDKRISFSAGAMVANTCNLLVEYDDYAILIALHSRAALVLKKAVAEDDEGSTVIAASILRIISLLLVEKMPGFFDENIRESLTTLHEATEESKRRGFSQSAMTELATIQRELTLALE